MGIINKEDYNLIIKVAEEARNNNQAQSLQNTVSSSVPLNKVSDNSYFDYNFNLGSSVQSNTSDESDDYFDYAFDDVDSNRNTRDNSPAFEGNSLLDSDDISAIRDIASGITGNTGTEQPKSLQTGIIEELERQNLALKREIESQMGAIQTQDDYYNSPDMVSIKNNVSSNVFNNIQPFENVISEPLTSTFNGNPFTYQRYETNLNFGSIFNTGMSDEDNARNYLTLCENITKDIKNKFGGWDRITDLAVISNLLVINEVSYEPSFPSSYVNSLPFDVRNNVIDGQFAWLFDFSVLRLMPNLCNMKFDSLEFPYQKVRKDLHITVDFEPKQLFKICKNLQVLEIGDKVLTFNTKNKYDDIFHKQKRSEHFYNSCLGFGFGLTKFGWGSVVNCYKDPDRSFLGKCWGLSWRGVGTATIGTATLGVKLGGMATKFAKGIKGGVSQLSTAVKDNL